LASHLSRDGILFSNNLVSRRQFHLLDCNLDLCTKADITRALHRYVADIALQQIAGPRLRIFHYVGKSAGGPFKFQGGPEATFHSGIEQILNPPLAPAMLIPVPTYISVDLTNLFSRAG